MRVRDIIALVIVFFAMIHFASAQVDTSLVEFGTEEGTIAQNLRKLRRISGQSFAFDVSALSIPAPDIAQKERELGETLDLLLADSGYTYKLFGETIAIVPGMQEPTLRENVRVSGQVLNVNSGESLPFTGVRVKGSRNAAVANQDGFFSLDEVPTDTSTLVLNFIGFKTAEYKLSPKADLLDLKVYLMPTASSLPEARVVESEGNMVRVEAIPSVQSVNISAAEIVGNNGLVDPFRPLQLLPGVDASDESNGGLSIRGSGSDQLLILFDGFTVYHVDHFYGIFSAFNPESIKHMRLSKGVYEARMGGRNSGFLEITGKEGSKYSRRVSAGVNLLTADLALEFPVLENRGSLVITGRRAYTDIAPTFLFKDLFNTLYNSSILQGAASSSEDSFGSNNPPSFTFHDLTGRFTFDPNKNDHLNLTVYQGRDNLGIQYNDPQPIAGTSVEYNDDSSWGNTGISGRWGHRWNSKNHTNIILAWSEYRSSLNTRDVLSNNLIGLSDTLFTEQSSRLQDRTLRINHELRVPGHRISFGTWMINRLITYEFRALSEGQLGILEQQGNSVSAYLQDEIRPNDDWLINAGMRMSYHDLAEDLRGEPRLSVSYKPQSRFSPKFAVGWNHQSIRRIRRQNLFLNTPDVWRLSNISSVPILSSFQTTIGAEGTFEKFNWDVEFYYKESQGEVLDPFDIRLSGNEDFIVGDGVAYGMDVLLQYNSKNWRTQLSYSLSESLLKFDQVNFGDWIYSPYNKRHQLKTVQHYRLGNWDLSATFVYSSGIKYTPALGVYTLELINGEEENFAAFGIPYSGTLPDYHRLDLNATYKFRWNKAMGEFGFSIYNVYNRQNIRDRSYQLAGGNDMPELKANNLEMLGVLPSVQLRFTWE